jgi:serine/threonine protein kinase
MLRAKPFTKVMKATPKLPLERVLKFAAQFAGALAAAHAEGVVHRDLKPQNILVDKNDQIYISDFGLARSFAEGALGMTHAGAVLGTPRYMSPEQVEGKTSIVPGSRVAITAVLSLCDSLGEPSTANESPDYEQSGTVKQHAAGFRCGQY